MNRRRPTDREVEALANALTPLERALLTDAEVRRLAEEAYDRAHPDPPTEET